MKLSLAAALNDGHPLAPKPAHFEPKAKQLLFVFLTGGFSHLDTFDPKPKLRAEHGKPIPAFGLRADVFGRGAAKTGPAAHRVFDAQNREYFLADSRLDRPHFGERQLFKAFFLRGGDGDEAPGDTMRLAERNTLHHQIISQVGRKQRRIGHGGGATVAMHGDSGHGAGEHVGTEGGLVETVEDGRLVLLQVAVVGERQAFQGRQQRDQAEDSGSGDDGHKPIETEVLAV